MQIIYNHFDQKTIFILMTITQSAQIFMYIDSIYKLSQIYLLQFQINMDQTFGLFKDYTEDEDQSHIQQKPLHPQISQQQAECYLKHIKYYYYLVKRNLETIKRIEQLSEMKKLYRLRKHLRIIYQDKLDCIGLISMEVIKELYELVKDSIHEKYVQMQQKKKTFYESVLIYNKMLLRDYNENCKILQKEPVNFHLFFLDIMSIFFRNSFEYRKVCMNKRHIVKSQLIFQIFNFNHSQYHKLIKAFRNCQAYVKYDVDIIFQELAIIYHIIRVRNRITYFDQITKQTIIYQKNKVDYRNLLPQTERKPLMDYNFCQLAYMSSQKQINSYPLCTRVLIMKYLNGTMSAQSNEQYMKRILLCIKFKFGLSFQSLSTIKDFFNTKKIDQIRKIFSLPESQQKDEGFQKPLPFIFLRDYSYSQAFQKFGMKQKYDLQLFQKRFHYKLDYVQKIVDVAFQQYEYLGFMMRNILKIEEQNEQRQYLTEIQNRNTMWQKIKKKCQSKDLVANLILVTYRSQVRSFFVVQQSINDHKYLKILRETVKDFIPIQEKKQFALIMYENQLGALVDWRQYDRFYAHMKRQYGIKVYVTNIRHYSELNMLILCHIKMRLQLIALTIAKKNFYDIVKKEAFQIIIQLSNKRFIK